jgi:hypothetical protein
LDDFGRSKIYIIDRLSPHGLHWPTVDEGLDTAALTSVFLMLSGRQNATTSGSGKNLVRGESVQPFNKRMNGHRSDLTKKTLLPVSQHFVSPGHSLDDFGRSKIYIIDRLSPHGLHWPTVDEGLDTAALTSVFLML